MRGKWGKQDKGYVGQTDIVDQYFRGLNKYRYSNAGY